MVTSSRPRELSLCQIQPTYRSLRSSQPSLCSVLSSCLLAGVAQSQGTGRVRAISHCVDKIIAGRSFHLPVRVMELLPKKGTVDLGLSPGGFESPCPAGSGWAHRPRPHCKRENSAFSLSETAGLVVPLQTLGAGGFLRDSGPTEFFYVVPLELGRKVPSPAERTGGATSSRMFPRHRRAQRSLLPLTGLHSPGPRARPSPPWFLLPSVRMMVSTAADTPTWCWGDPCPRGVPRIEGDGQGGDSSLARSVRLATGHTRPTEAEILPPGPWRLTPHVTGEAAEAWGG